MQDYPKKGPLHCNTGARLGSSPHTARTSGDGQPRSRVSARQGERYQDRTPVAEEFLLKWLKDLDIKGRGGA